MHNIVGYRDELMNRKWKGMEDLLLLCSKGKAIKRWQEMLGEMKLLDSGEQETLWKLRYLESQELQKADTTES